MDHAYTAYYYLAKEEYCIMISKKHILLLSMIALSAVYDAFADEENIYGTKLLSIDEENIYGTKLLSIDEDYLTGLKPETEYPEPGEMPSAEWLYYDGLRKILTLQFDPVWSSDGQWITCRGNITNPSIWLVPVEGGDPVLVYTHYNMYKEYYFTIGVEICDFTPDGKEILFGTAIIDESQGTTVTFRYNEDGSISGCHISGLVPLIMAANIDTGETRTVVEKGYRCCYSHNGKYFAYSLSTIEGLTIVDTETGDNWLLGEVPKYKFCFSFDDEYIIYSDDQLYKIPLRGGNSQQVTFYGFDDPTRRLGKPDCSPDGEWILFGGYGGLLSGTVSDSTSSISKIYAYNTFSGETIEFFPGPSAISTWQGSFSPDGTKICYNYEDNDQQNSSIEIYVKDFDLDSRESEPPSSVKAESPTSMVLYNNYPNPFNPTTTIAFSLPETGFTNIVIYNMTGQKIRDLVSGIQHAGNHSVVWNGCDEQDLPVSAGIYVVKLRTDDAVSTNKMILVK